MSGAALKVMHSLVSILIPAHNAQGFIAETIQSALAQTWKNKEIITVDNGSSDQKLHQRLGWKPRVNMEWAMTAFLGQFEQR
jgi:hypothetical protein